MRGTHQKQATKKVTKTSDSQVVVESFQSILARMEATALPTGRLGCEFLDCSKLGEKALEKVFAKAKKLLIEQPDAIPGWSVSHTAQRALSRDTAKVFEAFSEAHDIELYEFIKVCSTSLGALRGLLVAWHPEWERDPSRARTGPCFRGADSLRNRRSAQSREIQAN